MIDLDTLIAALREEGGGLCNNAADAIERLRIVAADREKAVAFILSVARMTTIEDEFAEDPGDYEDADEMRSDLSDDRLFDEFAALESIIFDARVVSRASAGVSGQFQGLLP